jgi:carboxyl-terminal processing protease
MFEKRKGQIQTYYREILAKPFDFTVEEAVETDGEKLAFAKNEKELKAIWRKSLKFQVMTRLADLMEDEEIADNGKDLAPKTYADLEKEAR